MLRWRRRDKHPKTTDDAPLEKEISLNDNQTSMAVPTQISSSVTTIPSTTNSYPTETSFTQASLLPNETKSSGVQDEATRNLLIGVGLGIFIVIIGALIYAYREKKGLDEDKSTLQIDYKAKSESAPPSPPPRTSFSDIPEADPKTGYISSGTLFGRFDDISPQMHQSESINE